jgi:predicted Zn-dependent protease
MPGATRQTWKSEAAEARHGSRVLLVLTLACACIASGCALFRDGPGYDAIDLIDATYTQDEQRQIGMDFDRALREQIRFIDDPVVTDFIEDLGESIVAETGAQPFVYRFRVIQAPSLNAFAVFGGYVYIHSGTLLAATSIDELAGVMGHEIAHVRMEHHARIQEKTKIPDMLAQIAGIAGAGVTGHTEVYTGAMGVNVALQLHFTRKLEAEADHHGTLYMAEAGYDPAGIARFFERIVAAQRGMKDGLPPYLYSHPEVEDRIGYVESQAAQLEVAEGNAPALAERMRDAQARLAQLLDADRASMIEKPQIAGNIIGPLMRAFERMRSEGRSDRALEMLRRAQLLEPNDPRVYFQRGELLSELERHDEAAAAFEKTIELDPARALPYFRLAETLEHLGERERAVRVYERAEFRAGANGQLRKRAAWAVMRLTFDEWAHCRNAAMQQTLPANMDGDATAGGEAARAESALRPCPGADS